MNSLQSFLAFFFLLTLPLIAIWTYFAKNILTTIASQIGINLSPLLYLVAVIIVNAIIVKVTLGKQISSILYGDNGKTEKPGRG